MQKLKEAFFSEKGMGIVNTLFCISAIFRKGWLTVAEANKLSTAA